MCGRKNGRILDVEINKRLRGFNIFVQTAQFNKLVVEHMTCKQKCSLITDFALCKNMNVIISQKNDSFIFQLIVMLSLFVTAENVSFEVFVEDMKPCTLKDTHRIFRRNESNIVQVNNQRDAAFVLLGLLSLYMFRTRFMSIFRSNTQNCKGSHQCVSMRVG